MPLSLVATFIPMLLLFLIILLIGWLIAKGLRTAVNAILERVGFDRAVERGGIGRTLAQSKYDASDLVAALVYSSRPLTPKPWLQARQADPNRGISTARTCPAASLTSNPPASSPPRARASGAAVTLMTQLR